MCEDYWKVSWLILAARIGSQKPGGANMFQEPVRRKKLRDDLWVKGYSPRNTRAAVSLNKNGQTVHPILDPSRALNTAAVGGERHKATAGVYCCRL